MAGRLNVMAGRLNVMAGRLNVMAGRLNVMAGRLNVMAGRLNVMAGLEPAIPSRTVRGEPVPHRFSRDGRVKPGHDDRATGHDDRATGHDGIKARPHLRLSAFIRGSNH
jgi:hypothetical protein